MEQLCCWVLAQTEARGKKKNPKPKKKRTSLLATKPAQRGRILDGGDVFCPNFFQQPHATAEARGSAAPGCSVAPAAPRHRPAALGAAHRGSPKWFWGEVPCNPEAPKHQAELWGRQSHLPPRVPLTFRHPWSSSSFSWLTRPGFLQMDGRVWLHGLSFHLPSCTGWRGAGLSPANSLGNSPAHPPAHWVHRLPFPTSNPQGCRAGSLPSQPPG